MLYSIFLTRKYNQKSRTIKNGRLAAILGRSLVHGVRKCHRGDSTTMNSGMSYKRAIIQNKPTRCGAGLSIHFH